MSDYDSISAQFLVVRVNDMSDKLQEIQDNMERIGYILKIFSHQLDYLNSLHTEEDSNYSE